MENMGNAHPSTGQVHEFHNAQNIVWPVLLAFGISFLMIVIIAANIFFLFVSSSAKPLMPGIIGGMSVIPIFGIAAGIYLLKRPRKVLVGPDGLTVIRMISRKEISWGTIADVEIKEVENVAYNWFKSFSNQFAGQNKCIVVRDQNRKKIDIIDGAIEGFDSLAAMIVSYSSQSQGKPVYDAVRQKTRTTAARRKKMRLNLGVGIFLVLMGIGGIVLFSFDYHSKQMLEKQGAFVSATIKRLYIYNITPRLEYTFSTADGKSYSKDVMVTKEFWDQLKEGEAIPVKYVPANPDNSRLLRGHVEDFDIPFPLLIVCFIIILGLGIGTACMYFMKIVDIKHENGKWKIVRLDDPELSIAQSPAMPAASQQNQKIQTPQTVSVINSGIQRPQCPAAAQEERKLPGGLKAIGILNIIFGIIGVLWNGIRIALVLIFVLNPEALLIQVDISENWRWVLFGHGASLLCAMALCISGIGILRFANWGRILAVLAVAVKLVMGLWEMGNVIFVPIENAAVQQAYLVNATKAFYSFIIILTLIYPLIVFILLNRRATRQWFQNKNIN